MSGAARPAFSAPQLLTAAHILENFSCGEPLLDDWLKTRALKDNDADASRTFVVTVGQDVAGYFALTVGGISHAIAADALRRNMPDPVPVTVLARLAIHTDFQGFGLGKSLLRDAVARSLQAGEHAAVKGMVVHALNERARAFYEGYGFARSPAEEMTLMAGLRGLGKVLGVA